MSPTLNPATEALPEAARTLDITNKTAPQHPKATPQCFTQSDGFFENDGRKQERRYRHGGGDNTSIDWRSETKSDGEAALIAYESKDSCKT